MSQDLEQLTEEIKYWFIETMRLKKPHYRTSPGSHKDFQAAAVVCARLDADPCTYVKAQAKYAGKFYPTCLHNSYSEKNYKKLMETKNVSYEGTFETNVKYLAIMLNKGYTTEEAITSEHVEFSSWFRILATEEPLQKIISKYIKAAKAEYSPELEEFLISKGLPYERIKNNS